MNLICNNCYEAFRSRGEPLRKATISRDYLEENGIEVTEDGYDELVKCDYCDELYPIEELNEEL